MCRLNKMISVIVVMTFALNVTICDYANGITTEPVSIAVNLSPASMLNDMMGLEYQDIGRIRMALLANRELLREKGKLTVSDLRSGKNPLFHFDDLHFLARELRELNNGYISVMCKLEDQFSTDTRNYYVIMPTDDTVDHDAPFYIYTQREYKRFQKKIERGELSIFDLPERPENDIPQVGKKAKVETVKDGTDDAIRVIAVTNILRGLWMSGKGFTLNDYLEGYDEVRVFFGLEAPGEDRAAAATKSLAALEKKGLLDLDNATGDGIYTLTDKGVELAESLSNEKDNALAIAALYASEKLRAQIDVRTQIEHLRDIIREESNIGDMASLLASAIAHIALLNFDGKDDHVDSLVQIATSMNANTVARNVATSALKTMMRSIQASERIKDVKECAERLEMGTATLRQVDILTDIVKNNSLSDVVEDRTELRALIIARAALLVAEVGEAEEHIADLLVVGSLTHVDDDIRALAHSALMSLAKKDKILKDLALAQEASENLDKGIGILQQKVTLSALLKEYDIEIADQNGLHILAVVHAAMLKDGEGEKKDHEMAFVVIATSPNANAEARKIATTALTEMAASITKISEVRDRANKIDDGTATSDDVFFLESIVAKYPIEEVYTDETKTLALAIAHSALFKAGLGDEAKANTHESALVLLGAYPTANDEVRKIIMDTLSDKAKNTVMPANANDRLKKDIPQMGKKAKVSKVSESQRVRESEYKGVSSSIKRNLSIIAITLLPAIALADKTGGAAVADTLAGLLILGVILAPVIYLAGGAVRALVIEPIMEHLSKAQGVKARKKEIEKLLIKADSGDVGQIMEVVSEIESNKYYSKDKMPDELIDELRGKVSANVAGIRDINKLNKLLLQLVSAHPFTNDILIFDVYHRMLDIDFEMTIKFIASYPENAWPFLYSIEKIGEANRVIVPLLENNAIALTLYGFSKGQIIKALNLSDNDVLIKKTPVITALKDSRSDVTNDGRFRKIVEFAWNDLNAGEEVEKMFRILEGAITQSPVTEYKEEKRIIEGGYPRGYYHQDEPDPDREETIQVPVTVMKPDYKEVNRLLARPDILLRLIKGDIESPVLEKLSYITHANGADVSVKNIKKIPENEYRSAGEKLIKFVEDGGSFTLIEKFIDQCVSVDYVRDVNLDSDGDDDSEPEDYQFIYNSGRVTSRSEGSSSSRTIPGHFSASVDLAKLDTLIAEALANKNLPQMGKKAKVDGVSKSQRVKESEEPDTRYSILDTRDSDIPQMGKKAQVEEFVFATYTTEQRVNIDRIIKRLVSLHAVDAETSQLFREHLSSMSPKNVKELVGHMEKSFLSFSEALISLSKSGAPQELRRAEELVDRAKKIATEVDDDNDGIPQMGKKAKVVEVSAISTRSSSIKRNLFIIAIALLPAIALAGEGTAISASPVLTFAVVLGAVGVIGILYNGVRIAMNIAANRKEAKIAAQKEAARKTSIRRLIIKASTESSKDIIDALHAAEMRIISHRGKDYISADEMEDVKSAALMTISKTQNFDTLRELYGASHKYYIGEAIKDAAIARMASLDPDRKRIASLLEEECKSWDQIVKKARSSDSSNSFATTLYQLGRTELALSYKKIERLIEGMIKMANIPEDVKDRLKDKTEAIISFRLDLKTYENGVLVQEETRGSIPTSEYQDIIEALTEFIMLGGSFKQADMFVSQCVNVDYKKDERVVDVPEQYHYEDDGEKKISTVSYYATADPQDEFEIVKKQKKVVDQAPEHKTIPGHFLASADSKKLRALISDSIIRGMMDSKTLNNGKGIYVTYKTDIPSYDYESAIKKLADFVGRGGSFGQASSIIEQSVTVDFVDNKTYESDEDEVEAYRHIYGSGSTPRRSSTVSGHFKASVDLAKLDSLIAEALARDIPQMGKKAEVEGVDEGTTDRGPQTTKTDPIGKAIAAYRENPVPLVMECESMDYAWGDPAFLPELLGINNKDKKPYAELWIGAHPKAPAKVRIGDTELGLDSLIDGASDEVLGSGVTGSFGNILPYLFKVLTASTALSIQSHPSKAQAEAGWAREKGEGPNYRDDNHKPEIICAITNFWALNGFRPVEDILTAFDMLNIPGLKDEVDEFKARLNTSENSENAVRDALKGFYSALMDRVRVLKAAQAEGDKIAAENAQLKITSIVSYVIDAARVRLSAELGIPKDSDLIFFIRKAAEEGRSMDLRRDLWALRLNNQYPNDMGVLSAYLLNLVRLNPGEAMYLPAGELHAYLGKLDPDATDEGAGMELMANSDNVLRGGLTPKHVDVPELISTLTFNYGHPEILTPADMVYQTSAPEFELSVIDLNPANRTFVSENIHSADSLIVMEGSVTIVDLNGNELTVEKGQTALIPAASRGYAVTAQDNTAKLYKASVPMRDITDLLVVQDVDRALLRVEDMGAGKKLETVLDEYARIYNDILDEYEAGKITSETVRAFTAGVIAQVVDRTGETEASHSIQLIAGQAGTIMSWMDRGLTETSNLGVTDADTMLRSDKGDSFLDAQTIPYAVGVTETENEPGFYWRGIEKAAKLVNGISKNLRLEKDQPENLNDAVVMYLMDHGFVPVPEGIKHLTKNDGGTISTIHETAFLNDMLRNSAQTTSTGPGHFQGYKLDIKHVVSGRGIQFNVKYGSEGNIERVLAQEVKAGDGCVALPGHVDYMVNLGGLRFNDMSLTLSYDQIKAFKRGLSEEDLAAAVKPDNAPYLGMRTGSLTAVVQHMEGEGVPAIEWMTPLSIFEDLNLIDAYKSLNSDRAIAVMVQIVSSAFTMLEVSDTNHDLQVLLASKVDFSDKKISEDKGEGDVSPDPANNPEVTDALAIAEAAGLSIPTHPDKRYTLLATSEFFANGELAEHQTRYGDRFDLDSIVVRAQDSPEKFVDKVLAKASGIETRTIALVPQGLAEEQLKRLTDAGIRFIRTDEGALLKARGDEKELREKFQQNTYVMMLLARRIDGSITKESSIYRLLNFYLRSHFSLDNISALAYIEAIVSGNIAMLIKGLLSYRPAEPYQVPDYDTIAATLIAA